MQPSTANQIRATAGEAFGAAASPDQQEACCESTLRSACCKAEAKTACCGSSPHTGACGCQPDDAGK